MNGVLVATGPVTANRFSDGGVLQIGRRKDGWGPVAGLIDDLSIYNRALAQTEIEAIFKAGATGKCPPAKPPEPEAPCPGGTHGGGLRRRSA